MLNDATVKAAIRDSNSGKKPKATLSDPSPRGAGTLILAVRPGLAEWYAQRFIDGKKKLTKLGAYPDMSIADARVRFATKDSPRPAAAPTIDGDDAPCGTPISGMFAAYVAAKSDAAENSLKQMKRIFELACEKWGGDRPAASITPGDIVDLLKPVYDRGAKAQADKFRVYINSAFTWAMRSTYDYKNAAQVDWLVRSNPALAVARDTDAEGVGNRWLSIDEYVAFMATLEPRQRMAQKTRYAILLIMLTGQRAQEILKIRAEGWNSKEKTITWEKTKNGLPHVLPVCERGARLLDQLKPSAGGWLFANNARTDKPAPDGSLLAAYNRYVRRYNKAHPRSKMLRFTSRDLRRTWKTLAGEAGLTKGDRDLLQNHMEGDVSSVHYDRYSYLREKRAAVAKWSEWIEAEIEKSR